MSPEDARELRDTIDKMMQEDDSAWHNHVSSADYQTEVTVALDRA